MYLSAISFSFYSKFQLNISKYSPKTKQKQTQPKHRSELSDGPLIMFTQQMRSCPKAPDQGAHTSLVWEPLFK